MEGPSRIEPEALKRLEEWGGPALVSKMIALFLEHSPERMDRVRAGVARSLPEEIERGAHSLKSSAANLGGTELRELLAVVEGHGERGEVDAVAALLPLLESLYRETFAELEFLGQGVEP